MYLCVVFLHWALVPICKNLAAMYRKELRYYFSTPVAYIAIGLFLLLISLFLWVLPGPYNIIDSGYAQVDGLFYLSPWLFLLLCPALTMRLFAEERQSGTWNLLLTKPLPLWRIVLAKTMAAWTVVIFALLPCALHLAVVSAIAEPRGNIDVGAFWGAFIGLTFVSLSFTAIGAFCSAVTRSQIVSFILGALLCAMLYYGFDLVAALLSAGHLVNFLTSLGAHAHCQSLARGVIDLRDLVYFLSTFLLFFLLTIRILYKK